MSSRNGDKARFGKQKKRKMANRLKVRALREDLKAPASETAVQGPGGEAAQDEHHGVLGSAAKTLGSTLGALAAKVKGVAEHHPAPAE